jgi:SlyX protein
MNDERIARLEEKLAWLQRHVTEQDEVMLGLAEQIERLKKNLLEISQQPDAETGPPPASDDRPPHY